MGEIELKIKLFLSLFILYSTFLNAINIIEINYEKLNLESFNVGYILDTESSYNIDTIKNKKFEVISNHHSFGNTSSTLWIKFEIRNNTKIDKKIFLHNNFAYFSKEIVIYEFQNNRLLEQNLYNILEDSSNKLTGSVLVYPLTLDAKSSKVLYIRTTSMVTQTTDLNIYDEEAHIEALMHRSFIPNVLIMILLSLAIYNIFLYFFNKRKELLFYSLYLINALIGLSYMYGTIFQDFGIYGEKVYWVNINAILVSGLLALFIKSIFNFKQGNKILNTMLNSIIYLVILDTLIAIFVDLQLSIDLVMFIYLYSFSIIFYIGFILYKQKHQLANIFLIAYIIYMIGFSLTILSIFGIIPLNSFTFYASGISLVIEAFLFSYLIHYHSQLLKNKLVEQQNTLILKNQKAQMGDMIRAITHQWKQPLNTISSTIMLLQFKIEDNESISHDTLKTKLTQMDKNIHFLVETIDDFKNFFKTNKEKKESDLTQLIKKAIYFSKDDLLDQEIIIKTDLHFTRKVNILENELLHIILNIIQNSQEAFRDIKNMDNSIKMIKIIGNSDENNTYINIIDNAGGISEDTLPYIFHENYTTKDKKDGTGLGLYLSKIIIEDHLGGSIEANNIADGTMFRIVL